MKSNLSSPSPNRRLLPEQQQHPPNFSISSSSHKKSLLSNELALSRKQYFELLKAYKELEETLDTKNACVAGSSSFEIEELREINASLTARIEELESERETTLSKMFTII